MGRLLLARLASGLSLLSLALSRQHQEGVPGTAIEVAAIAGGGLECGQKETPLTVGVVYLSNFSFVYSLL